MGKIIRVSMLDIARCAGVSQATVSLALRNHRSIPRETRERIAETAAKLGYEPNGAISTLMARVRSRRLLSSRGTLGAITSWPDPKKLRDREMYTYRLFFEGARKRAGALGYDFDVLWTGEKDLTMHRLSAILAARGIEGVLIFPVYTPEPLVLEWENMAGATMGYTLQWPPLHRASSDQYEAVIVAISNLRARGYERIGLAVDGTTNERLKRRWLAAFCACEFGAGGGNSELIAVLGGNRQKGFEDWVRRVQPDAVLFGHLPAQEWIAEMGLRAPDDVGLVGLSAVYSSDGCAHIDERSDQVGAAAVDLVVAQLHRNERGIPGCQHELFVVGKWVDGTTVRPAESHAPGV